MARSIGAWDGAFVSCLNSWRFPSFICINYAETENSYLKDPMGLQKPVLFYVICSAISVGTDI